MQTGHARSLVIASLAALALVIPRTGTGQPASADSWRPELSAGFALGHVFRWDDVTFGNEPNVTVSAALFHRTGFGVELEFNRTFGLSPAEAPCGILIDGVPATCVGTGHDGVRSAGIAALTAQYQFGAGRLRPYLIGGIGVLKSTSVWSTARIVGRQVVLTEDEMSDMGLGPDLGVGLRFDVTRHVSIKPELRWLDASLLSRTNLAVTRLSTRVAYSW